MLKTEDEQMNTYYIYYDRPYGNSNLLIVCGLNLSKDKNLSIYISVIL